MAMHCAEAKDLVANLSGNDVHEFDGEAKLFHGQRGKFVGVGCQIENVPLNDIVVNNRVDADFECEKVDGAALARPLCRWGLVEKLLVVLVLGFNERLYLLAEALHHADIGDDGVGNLVRADCTHFHLNNLEKALVVAFDIDEKWDDVVGQKNWPSHRKCVTGRVGRSRVYNLYVTEARSAYVYQNGRRIPDVED